MSTLLHAIILATLVAAPVLAREVNDFTLKDGQGSYAFRLDAAERRLFFYTYQKKDHGDMRSQVFIYKPTGPAPIDSVVVREEIATAVKGLFFTERGRVDAAHVAELPGGIACYPMAMITDGSSMDGLGLKFTVENGAIMKVEVAACVECGLQASLMKEYEAKK